jgi:hypothetical protein
VHCPASTFVEKIEESAAEKVKGPGWALLPSSLGFLDHLAEFVLCCVREAPMWERRST